MRIVSNVERIEGSDESYLQIGAPGLLPATSWMGWVFGKGRDQVDAVPLWILIFFENRQDAERGEKSLSDFSSDIVTRYPAALGVVAASAVCWSPVFTGAE